MLTTYWTFLRRRLRPYAPDAAVFAGLCAVTVLATWPYARFVASRFPFGLEDESLISYIVAWQAHTLPRPLRLFAGPSFYPFGSSLLLSEQLLGGSLVAAPIWVLTHNPALTANLLTLATFPVAAFGAYLLLRDVTGSRVAGIVAGTAFGFSAFRLSHPTFIHVLLTMWLPFVLVQMRRFARELRWRQAIATGAFLALQVASSGHGALMVAPTAAIAGIVLVAREPSLLAKPQLWVRGAIVGAAVVLAVSPIVLAYSGLYRDHPEFRRDATEVALYSAGPRGLATASSSSRLYGSAVRGLPEGTLYAWEKTLFPGFAILVVAAVGGLTLLRPGRHREQRTWGLAFVGMTAFGAAMAVGGSRHGLFALVSRLVPGYDTIRVPGRFMIVASLGLAGLAGLATASIGGRSGRWRQVAGGSAVAVLLLSEAAVAPYPMVAPPPVPAAYRWIATQPSRPLLALPTGELYPPHPGEVDSATLLREARYLWFLPTHWSPILNGYGGNVPRSYVEMVTIVRDFPNPTSVAYLQKLGVRHVLAHRDLLGGGPWAQLESQLRAAAPRAIVIDEPAAFVVDLERLVPAQRASAAARLPARLYRG